MHKFRCPDGHEFEAKRNFYAHCPTCGKNSKRVYDAKDDPPPEESKKPADEKPEDKPPEQNQPPKEDEPKPEDGKRNSVRRVKVKRGQATKKEDDKTSTNKPSDRSPAKKVKVRKGAAPKVNKKIVTTRDRKMNKEKKEEHATQWNRVRSFRLF